MPCSRSPDGPNAVRIRLVVVVLVARIGRVPVLVPRVRGACPCTHTSCCKIIHCTIGWVAFSLVCTNGHGPDQMDARNHRSHFDSANKADDLIQP